MAEESVRKLSTTDFSIDRILSDEPRTTVSDTPSWLCCTRYRPPRLPRVANTNCRSRRAGRHARVPFTAAQASALEAAYARAPYLAPPALKALAAALQLRDDRIKIWFQNRRARERREKCTNISPPEDVTLPPTDAYSQMPNYFMQEINNRTIIESETPNFIVNCPQSFPEAAQCNSLQIFNFEANKSSNNRAESPLNVDSIDDE